MKCYFAYDELYNKKVLIPGCYQVVHTNNISDCTCKDDYLSYNQFEKKVFNDKVNELNNELKSLREFIDTLKKDNYNLMKKLNLK